MPKEKNTLSSSGLRMIRSLTYAFYTLSLFTLLFIATLIAEKSSNESKKEQETDDIKSQLVSKPIQEEGLQLVSPELLGGGNRHLAHTSTDKPIYRIGETVRIRSIVLNAHLHTPHPTPNLTLNLKIMGPKGDQLFQQKAAGENSSLGLAWEIPEGTPGGVYKVIAASPWGQFTTSEREFEIRAYRPPAHDIDITFIKDGYGPNDLVQTSVSVKRNSGDIPLDAELRAVARVDGEEIYRETLKVPQTGFVDLSFSLPSQIKFGEGSLNLTLFDGGKTTFKGKDLPIITHHLDLHFYPESGDLVQGLESRVYFQAYQLDGKPADIKGHLVDASGQHQGIELQTQHEGRGLFRFTPTSQQLFLKIDEPSGFRRPFALPKAKAMGATLEDLTHQASYPSPTFKIQNSDGLIPSAITLSKKEILLDRIELDENELQTPISLNPGQAHGVIIATLWDENGLPLAERLVFQQPSSKLHIQLDVQTQHNAPGQPVEIQITTKDELGKPTEAIVALTVTDERVLQMIENREQAPRLPEMAFLENEVIELRDPTAYLAPNNQEAISNLDLLLGIQGWRRYLIARYDQVSQLHLEPSQKAMAWVDLKLKETFKKIKVEEAAFSSDSIVLNSSAPPPAQKSPAPSFLSKRKPFKLAKPKQEMAEVEEALDVAGLIDFDEWRQPWVIIREYAHPAKPQQKANERDDFTETLYWNAGLKTNAETGTASVNFHLSDSITRFSVQADAFSSHGALGSADSEVISQKPFYLEARWPLSLTVGDEIQLPVSLNNLTSAPMPDTLVTLTSEEDNLHIESHIDLQEQSGDICYLPLRLDRPGTYTFTLSATHGDHLDQVTRHIKVESRGFPIQHQLGGQLQAGKPGIIQVTLPENIHPGSLKTLAKVFPTPLAHLEEALASLLVQPHGCFEQTSSTNYPLVMAQQYFLSHQGVDPQKIEKAKKLLQKGYDRLRGFECKQGGYEWFGADPGHEGLTAYGLMQFHDMATFMEVDSSMLKRTRAWLMDRRDGQGSFKKSKKKLDSFGGAKGLLADAYLVWALLESGEPAQNLQTEIQAIQETISREEDPYTLALIANLLHLAGNKDISESLCNKLAQGLNDEGALNQAQTSITSSRGKSLFIETTSLAILAWLRNPKTQAEACEKATRWVLSQCQSGRFGNTQATILALKAIVAFDKSRAKPKAPGSLQLTLNGELISDPIAFDQETQGAIHLPNVAAALGLNKTHQLGIQMEKGSKMPFSLEVSYHSDLPPSYPKPALKLTTTLKHSDLSEGEPTELNISLQAQEDTPTPIAIIGLPNGLELRQDQLKAWVIEDKISSYETGPGTLTLYWRGLEKGEFRNLSLNLVAAIPGQFTASASKAYPYYHEENVVWAKGTQITIHQR